VFRNRPLPASRPSSPYLVPNNQGLELVNLSRLRNRIRNFCPPKVARPGLNAGQGEGGGRGGEGSKCPWVRICHLFGNLENPPDGFVSPPSAGNKADTGPDHVGSCLPSLSVFPPPIPPPHPPHTPLSPPTPNTAPPGFPFPPPPENFGTPFFPGTGFPPAPLIPGPGSFPELFIQEVNSK